MSILFFRISHLFVSLTFLRVLPLYFCLFLRSGPPIFCFPAFSRTAVPGFPALCPRAALWSFFPPWPRPDALNCSCRPVSLDLPYVFSDPVPTLPIRNHFLSPCTVFPAAVSDAPGLSPCTVSFIFHLFFFYNSAAAGGGLLLKGRGMI